MQVDGDDSDYIEEEDESPPPRPAQRGREVKPGKEVKPAIRKSGNFADVEHRYHGQRKEIGDSWEQDINQNPDGGQ